MILHCNFEELQALSSGAELVASEWTESDGGAVAAPSEVVALVEALRPRLVGDVSLATLAAQRRVRRAVAYICQRLHARMDRIILLHGPAHEEAVAVYFDYGHARTVLERLDVMGEEMHAIIELITGTAPTADSAETVTFPD